MEWNSEDRIYDLHEAIVEDSLLTLFLGDPSVFIFFFFFPFLELCFVKEKSFESNYFRSNIRLSVSTKLVD